MNKRQLLIIASVIITIIVNFWVDLAPLGGISTAEVSDSIPILFVPAGYVFAIWGVIYFGLIAYAYYQSAAIYSDAKWLRKLDALFVLASAANIWWLIIWHYQLIELSVIPMLVLLGSLIMLYRKLEVGRYKVSRKTYWMVHAPISLYLGWISVATIANISGALFTLGWDGAGIHTFAWAAIMVVIAGILGMLMLLRRKDVIFAGVIVWALTGIIVKFAGVYPLHVGASMAVSVLLLIVMGKIMLDTVDEVFSTKKEVS